MDETPRRIYLGVLPSGADVFVGEGQSDPVAILLREANARLDAERAAEARAIAAAAADIERVKATRRAHALKRLTKAFKAFASLR
jgi:hypothetical protein